MQIVKAYIEGGKCYIGEKGGETPAPVAADINMLTLGEADSEGFAFIGHDSACYIAQTVSNVREILDDLIKLTGDIKTITKGTDVMTNVEFVPKVSCTPVFKPASLTGLTSDVEAIEKRLKEIKLV